MSLNMKIFFFEGVPKYKILQKVWKSSRRVPVTIRSFLELWALFLRESEDPGSAGSLHSRHGAGGLRGHEAGAAGARGPGRHVGLGRPGQLLHTGPRARLAHQILPGKADQDQGNVNTQHREDYV